MTFSIQVLGTSSGIPLTFPCPSRDQPPPEAVGPVPCSHLSHRMHCISGGALQCNEHVLHCVALFFSEPESSSSLCSWLCCSRFQCNESPTLHSPPHASSSYIVAGFIPHICHGHTDGVRGEKKLSCGEISNFCT